jgi:hypothetical protein
MNLPEVSCDQRLNENPRRISPTRVSFDPTLDSYFLQHLPGQHFALPLQQSVTGDAAVAVPMNAARVAIRRRCFIRSSFFNLLKNSATNFHRAEPTVRRTRREAAELVDAQRALLRARH